jgi:hypothetical protein
MQVVAARSQLPQGTGCRSPNAIARRLPTAALVFRTGAAFGFDCFGL